MKLPVTGKGSSGKRVGLIKVEAMAEKISVMASYLFIQTTDCEEVNDISLSELVFSKLKYYPNPVLSDLTIDLGERFEVLKVNVVDASGRAVLKDIYLKKQKIVLDLSGLPKGVYYVSLQGNGAVHNLKISKD